MLTVPCPIAASIYTHICRTWKGEATQAHNGPPTIAQSGPSRRGMRPLNVVTRHCDLQSTAVLTVVRGFEASDTVGEDASATFCSGVGHLPQRAHGCICEVYWYEQVIMTETGDHVA